MEKRCRTLESINIHKVNKEFKVIPTQKHIVNSQFKKRVFHTATKMQINKKLVSCFICEKMHSIFNCADFLKLNPDERLQHIKSMNRCTNCFSKGHFTKDCTASGCRQCPKRHHTLLHMEHGDTRDSHNDEHNVDNPGEGTSQCHLVLSNNVLYRRP